MEQQQLGRHHPPPHPHPLHHHEKELNIDDDPTATFDRKIDVVTTGARPFVKEHLLTRITRENCLTIVNYMLAMQTEVSPTETYRIDTLFKLKYFAEFHNPKTFKDMTRQDVIDFLANFLLTLFCQCRRRCFLHTGKKRRSERARVKTHLKMFYPLQLH
jgi:hypothetical protein